MEVMEVKTVDYTKWIYSTVKQYVNNPVSNGTHKRTFIDRDGNTNTITVANDETSLPVDRSSVEKLEAKKTETWNARAVILDRIVQALEAKGENATIDIMLNPRAIQYSLVFGQRILDLAYNRLLDSLDIEGNISTLAHAYKSVLYAVKQYRLHHKGDYLSALEALEAPAVVRYKDSTLEALDFMQEATAENQYRYYQPDTLTIADCIGKDFADTVRKHTSETVQLKLRRLCDTVKGMDAELELAFFNRRDIFVFIHRVYSKVKYNGQAVKNYGLSIADFWYLIKKYY